MRVDIKQASDGAVQFEPGHGKYITRHCKQTIYKFKYDSKRVFLTAQIRKVNIDHSAVEKLDVHGMLDGVLF